MDANVILFGRSDSQVGTSVLMRDGLKSSPGYFSVYNISRTTVPLTLVNVISGNLWIHLKALLNWNNTRKLHYIFSPICSENYLHLEVLLASLDSLFTQRRFLLRPVHTNALYKTVSTKTDLRFQFPFAEFGVHQTNRSNCVTQ